MWHGPTKVLLGGPRTRRSSLTTTDFPPAAAGPLILRQRTRRLTPVLRVYTPPVWRLQRSRKLRLAFPGAQGARTISSKRLLWPNRRRASAAENPASWVASI